MLCTKRNLEKLKGLRRAHKNPTGQNSRPICQSKLLTSKHHAHLDKLRASRQLLESQSQRNTSVPSTPKFGDRSTASPFPLLPWGPAQEGPEAAPAGGEKTSTVLAGTSARNSGLKINEGSVLSSELTETERTSAGSLLTTRQPGLLLQLFRPQTTSAGRGCSRSSLGAAPCVTAQEAMKERRRARHCQGSSGHLAQPGGELD